MIWFITDLQTSNKKSKKKKKKTLNLTVGVADFGSLKKEIGKLGFLLGLEIS